MIGRDVRVTLLRALIWVLVFFFIFRIALVRVQVTGISMLPTYADHSKKWVNRLAFLWHEPRRGDIVVISYNRGAGPSFHLEPPHVMLFKRIIGLPGETVAFAGGHVLINGAVLSEPYETLPCSWSRRPVTLAPDEYFVVGDNRSMPQDYHTFGICKRYQIGGKVLL
jgi:signal peptidase I